MLDTVVLQHVSPGVWVAFMFVLLMQRQQCHCMRRVWATLAYGRSEDARTALL